MRDICDIKTSGKTVQKITFLIRSTPLSLAQALDVEELLVHLLHEGRILQHGHHLAGLVVFPQHVQKFEVCAGVQVQRRQEVCKESRIAGRVEVGLGDVGQFHHVQRVLDHLGFHGHVHGNLEFGPVLRRVTRPHAIFSFNYLHQKWYSMVQNGTV